MNNIAIYARVSTTDKGQDAETQLMPLRGYCERGGLEVYKVYVDEISAVKTRPAFNEMMNDARLLLFGAIIVWKLDRFARSMKDFVMVTMQLERYAVGLVSLTEGIDTRNQNPAAKMMMHMLAAMAEYERSLIQERVKAGIARRRAAGLPIGRNKLIMSFDRLAEWVKEGLTEQQIADKTGASLTTVQRRKRLLREGQKGA